MWWLATASYTFKGQKLKQHLRQVAIVCVQIFLLAFFTLMDEPQVCKTRLKDEMIDHKELLKLQVTAGGDVRTVKAKTVLDMQLMYTHQILAQL